MSWYAQAWAECAPVADVYERAIISLLSHRSKKDGRAAYPPSNAKIARYAMCDVKSVKRRMKAMQERGLIRPGDPAVVKHIEARFRPNVWDLQIPFSWFSASQVQEINRERAEDGEPDLTAELRPDLAPAPDRKRRADAGIPRPRADEDDDETPDDMPAEDPDAGQGGLSDPPEEQGGLTDPPGAGGTDSPGQGGLAVQTGGDYKTPSTGLNGSEQFSSTKEPPTPAARRESRAPSPHGRGSAPASGSPVPDPSTITTMTTAGGRCEHGRTSCRPCGTTPRARASAAQAAAAASGESCTMCVRTPSGGWQRIDPVTRAPLDIVRGVAHTRSCDHTTPHADVQAEIDAAERSTPVA